MLDTSTLVPPAAPADFVYLQLGPQIQVIVVIYSSLFTITGSTNNNKKENNTSESRNNNLTKYK